MKFELLPIIELMEEVYRLPISGERFQKYIFLLRGTTKDDMILPIGGFNPMGKPQVAAKLEELKNLQAESIIEKTLEQVNESVADIKRENIKVGLNLADDVGGAWTHSYATDYDSKFKLNPLIERHFCTPYFWVSENFTKKIIEKRTLEYLARTIYQVQNERPKTLEAHIAQEIFVHQQSNKSLIINKILDVKSIHSFYEEYKNTEDYSIVFNFLYGDKASASLGYTSYGMPDNAGFLYAQYLARKQGIKDD